jgi:hypothetical protein
MSKMKIAPKNEGPPCTDCFDDWRRRQEHVQAIFDAHVTGEDIAEIILKMVGRAKIGDAAAATFVMQHAAGRPV